MQRSTKQTNTAHVEFRDAIAEFRVNIAQLADKTRESSKLFMNFANKELEMSEKADEKIDPNDKTAGVTRLEKRID